MRKIKSKLAMVLTLCLLAGGMLFNTNTMSAASDPANAPIDWAFEASSVELNDAIVGKYPELGDVNGYVTKTLAQNWTGISIILDDMDITGTIYGIENFTNSNLRVLSLNHNQFTGNVPANIENISSLNYLGLHIITLKEVFQVLLEIYLV